ncbi:hypothetical protein FA95DRAFT_1602038 [Auriscalpium vulgare]|uniref:Uncharacterized protein n=1 Tax=Auriscalpium vulgare TaxID=40419 RepID=A0ACB8S717_9AGAM|nr:hypothetical protein FA95DRAFT_1602038 [Auriscalpium vulgare]
MVSFERLPKPSSVPARRAVLPRPLLSVAPPSILPPLPALPSAPRAADFGHSYTLSTHIIPSASPRNTPDIPLPHVPEKETKQERRDRLRRQTTEVLELKEAYERGEVRGAHSEKALWNVVNRYVRKGAGSTERKGITVFMAHANGLHKETFEPILHHLLPKTASGGSYQIDEVWTFDAVQHGDSALLNAAHLGGLFDWADNSRDILNFFLHYLPEAPSSEPMPLHLPRVPSVISDARRVHGLRQRTLVTVGHSFGGTSLALAAHYFPSLFSGLVLVDPVIMPFELDRRLGVWGLTYGGLSRRETWPSKEEAVSSLSASPFFGRWHPDVFKLYLDHAITTMPSGEVKLKCTSIQEATVFVEAQCTREVWTIFDKLPEHIAIHWIVCPTEDSVVPEEDMQRERVWRRPANSTNIRILDVTHLLIQEVPRDVAEVLHDFFLDKFTEKRAKL